MIDHIICCIAIGEERKCIQWLLNDYKDVAIGFLEIIFSHGFWESKCFWNALQYISDKNDTGFGHILLHAYEMVKQWSNITLLCDVMAP